ncbi:MAG: cadherin-like beta sandwich domain-containing protein, partial [Mariniphaga sp.]|nr:cadherin-like beta sandwich domain-containing protein [Mariniphaga sp.]
MRLKLLLLSVLLTGMLNAQDTIRTLIISEVRMDRADHNYVELTNVGSESIQMDQFEFGRIDPWTTPYDAPIGSFMRLPSKSLEPGETFVIAVVRDFTEKMYPLYPDFFDERQTKKEWWELADIQIHVAEAKAHLYPQYKDSVSSIPNILEAWGGRDCFYIEQHFLSTDSVIVDQVGGVFDEEDGTNYDKSYDVAGFTGATGNSILVRKASVNQGTEDFNSTRGSDISESQWIPIPVFSNNGDTYAPWRAVFWTVGFHGDVTLDENTLQSDVLEVDWANKTITAPWGVRNNDDFMMQFEKVPGLAWKYDLSPTREDSAYNSARTGDKLTVYACGNTLQTEVFNIIVQGPNSDANIVIPKYELDYDPKGSFYSAGINSGTDEYFDVTFDAPEMDTITNSLFGIGFATRKDTLLTYLEKAPNAQWEIIWVDGVERPDVKNGDILKVTAESGAIKEYFIKVDQLRPSHTAELTAITWPDIPQWMRGLFNWKGDTIPNFNSTTRNYKVTVPSEVNGIPALIPLTDATENSEVEVKRATSLSGSDEQRTIKFTVTAEDDTTQSEYNVLFEKEKAFDDIQPFSTEPFISEYVWQDQWNNGFVEICNPGNQPLDLSDYMITTAWTADPSEAITWNSGVDEWNLRYYKYIPGYKWVEENTWSVSPGTLIEDLNVPRYVQPGDVFVIGHINSLGTLNAVQPSMELEDWWAYQESDVILNSPYNPWNEPFSDWGSAVHQWTGANTYLYKIVGPAKDSIKNGLKPANDPNDFELIDSWGMADGSGWVIGGISADQRTTWIRKPEVWQGNPVVEESFGTDEETSEWIMKAQTEWQNLDVHWALKELYDTKDLGQHHFYEVTDYMSTISSIVYKVSDGYKTESLRGVVTGTTVAEFLSNIIKKNEEQTLSVKAMDGGSELADADLLSLNDTLVVVSADGERITKYVLNVSEEGLSSDAVLTSTLYNVVVENEPKSASQTAEDGTGYIEGFEYGTQLSTILNNVDVPMGAVMNMIDGEGAYVSLKRLNFDTTYVDVTVNANTYFDVLAENGITRIIYQLRPSASENDAFILSDIYMVSQAENLVHYVPRGTNV